jgi:hypothetical protein
MSAELTDGQWVVTCEILCGARQKFDGDLDEEKLGEAIRAAGWEIPVYGGTFCPRCYQAVKTLSRRNP